MRIYIDCTNIALTGLNTGIQRVERNIINNAFDVAQLMNIEIQPVVYLDRYGFVKIRGVSNSDLVEGLGYLNSIRLRLRQYWRFRLLAKAVFPNRYLSNWIESCWKMHWRWILAVPLMLAMMPILLLSIVSIHCSRVRHPWNPSAEDIFVIPGSSWWRLDLKLAIDEVKQQGGRLVVLIHDLIPILHSRFFKDERVNTFRNNLNFICMHVDLLIANSQTTKKAIVEYIVAGKLPKPPALAHFQLGADLDLANKADPIRAELRYFFNNGDVPFLSVGTIEPRKNYDFLLDSFEYVWRKYPEARLCIVGRYGWKAEAFLQRMQSHLQWKRNLVWFDDLSDSELAYCYQNTASLIFPSFIEGFGLPLVEALKYGCPVIASDIEIFREIGREYCIYFSLDNSKHLAETVGRKITGKNLNIHRLENFKWISWKESTFQFLSLIHQHFSEEYTSRS
jgi:alpha-1,2-rhamnosyltransferase